MKVLEIIARADIGGIERLVGQLTWQLSKSGQVDCAVLCLLSGSGTMAEYYRGLAIRVIDGGLSSGWDGAPWKLYRIWRLFRQYDIVHFHIFNPVVCFVARLSGRRVCFTEHGEFGFGCAPTLKRRIKSRLKSFWLRHLVDGIFFNSYFSQALVRKYYGMNLAGTVIYNGLELAETESAEDDEPGPEMADRLDGCFVVGVVARFAGVKRIDRLIDAFADFARNKQACLMLVGDGPLRQEYIEQARRNGVADKLYFTGYRSDVSACFSRMDVSVLPSANETFGLAYLEAMACGVPSVAFSDGGGLAEIARQFDPADVVDDVAALTSRLEYYWSHPQTGESRGCRRAFAAGFSLTAMADKIHREYERMVPAGAAKRDKGAPGNRESTS